MLGGAEAGKLAADRLAANVGLIDNRSQCLSNKKEFGEGGLITALSRSRLRLRPPV